MWQTNAKHLTAIHMSFFHLLAILCADCCIPFAVTSWWKGCAGVEPWQTSCCNIAYPHIYLCRCLRKHGKRSECSEINILVSALQKRTTACHKCHRRHLWCLCNVVQRRVTRSACKEGENGNGSGRKRLKMQIRNMLHGI